MPALTRRRSRSAPAESWQIFYGDVQIGTIGIRAGVPVGVDQWAPALDDRKRSRVGHRQMRMSLHWTALLLGVLAVAPLAAEAALRLYASYVTKRDHLYRSDAQMGWTNEPTLPA